MEEKTIELLIALTRQALTERQTPLRFKLNQKKRQHLIEMTRRNSLLSLIASYLAETIDGSNGTFFRKAVMKNSVRNELIRREIRRLLERCRKYRIEPVFFGGVVTASEDDRQTPSDIDLLISRKETKTMEALLRSLGYVTDAANLHKSWEMTFGKQAPFPLEVDVHWRLTFPTHGRLDPLPKEKIETLTENFRSGAKKTIFRGQEILTPKPEDLLVYQIIHFIINHNARGLKWLYGMARDIRQTRIDWPLFLEKITSMDLKSLAYFTFRLTDDILNTKPPDKVM